MVQKQNVSRRTFFSASAAGSALAIMSAKTALGSEANSAIAVGLIGCGGRGNHDAENFRRAAHARIAALADPFEDRLASTKQHFQSDDPKIFQGFGAYEKLLQTDVDAVIITSPPYFHPEHFEAAVDAKKHVYLEKPVAVDAFGANRVLKAGQKADGKITAMVGFQTRYSPDMQEAVKRVHNGAIGEIVCGQAHYHSGWLSPQHKPNMSEEEKRLRNWVFDIVLSGDILVEQNIHVLDVCNWVMGTHPVKAYGTGGRKIRTAVGDTWDHYGVTVWYPDGQEVVFASTQFLKLGWGDAGERFNGSKGAFDALVGRAKIRGEQEWSYQGESENSEIRKIQAFYESIQSRNYINEIAQGVESTLTAIMGRTAAYHGKEYAWDEMISDNEKLEANLRF
ncbi:MAG: Gfo/Idh/MocA family protein [Candidatus Hinthialibacter sp.]